MDGFAELIERKRQGSLKVYLGYAAGVGKTYAMLQEGLRLKQQHVDVVIGYLEPHDRPETMALAEHLEAVHGVGPHTISMPRIKRADDIDPSSFDNGISDDIFAKLCALIRISVPYTGMIISTRESAELRARVIKLGVSQISGGSRTSVGGYTEEERPEDTEQFDVSDRRTLDEVVRWLIESGYIPSFCTACYREGRTGDRFMSLCKNGQILNCCHPNALMTLTEYLVDYASEETKKVGFELIERELKKIPKDKVRQIAAQNIEAIKASDRRDFRF